MPQNPYNRSELLSQARIVSPKEIGTVIAKVRAELGTGTYTVREEGKFGDYTRISVSKGSFTGENALVLDIRAGPSTAASEPALFIRTKGSLDSSSEIAIGASISPAARPVGGAYELREPTRVFVKTIEAAFEETSRARDEGYQRRPKQVRDEFISLTTSSDDAKHRDVRKKYGLAAGSNVMYSIPTQGEQIAIASKISVAFAGQDVEKELLEIERMMAQGTLGYRLPGKRNIVPLNAYGAFAQKRVRSGVWVYDLAAETETVTTAAGNVFHDIFVKRGASGDPAALMKHLKATTTWFRARPTSVYQIRYNKGGPSEIIQPGSTEAMEAATFGEMLGKDKYDPYIKSSLLYPRETERVNARMALTLVAAMPTHEGAAVINTRLLRGVDAFGVAGGKTVELPFMSPQELILNRPGGPTSYKDILQFATNIIGKRIGAGTTRPLQIGAAIAKKGTKYLDIGSREYTQELTGGTVIIPPWMNVSGTKFYATKDAVSGEELISTATLAKQIEQHTIQYGVRVQNSGIDKVEFSYQTINEVAADIKSMSGIKAGTTDPGGPNAPSIRIGRGKSETNVTLGMVTKEVKQIVESMAGAFDVQPYENKAKMLGMVDNKLERWFRENYKPGDAISLPSLGVEYSKLGKATGTHYFHLFGDMLDKFMNPGSENINMANFKRFGIYMVKNDAEVQLGRIHEEALNLQRVGAKRLGTTLRKLGIGYKPIEGLDDIYEYSFKAKANRSMILPTTIGMAIENPGQSREINADIVSAISSQYSEFAAATGLLPELGPMSTPGGSDRRGWANIAKAYMFNASAIQGDVYVPDKARRVDRKLAEEIIDSGIFSMASEESEEQVMARLQDKLGNEMLYFGTTHRFLPGVKDILGVEQFSTGQEYGEGVSRYATQYISSVRQLLEAEISGHVDPSAVAAHSRFIGGPESRIGRILATGKGVQRHIFGKEVKGGAGGHYRVSSVLKNDEVFIGKQEIIRMARKMGLEKTADIKKLYDYINDGNRPSGLFWRYPTLSNKHATAEFRIVGEKEIARRRGKRTDELDPLNVGTIWMGTGVAEKMIGDEDIDPGGWLAGFTPVFEKVEKVGKDGRHYWTPELVGFEDVLGKDPAFGRKVNPFRDLAEVVGEDLVNEYSTVMKALSEYMVRGGAQKGSPLNNARDYGTVTREQWMKGVNLRTRIMTRRGTSHIALTQMKTALAAVGVPADLLNQIMKGAASLYQKTLESTMEAGTSTPLEILSKTITFTPVLGGGESMQNQWASNFLKMTVAFDENEEGQIPSSAWRGDLLNSVSSSSVPNLNRYITNTLLQFSKMKELSNEALAAGFADPKDFANNYNKLLTQMNLAKTPEERYNVLIGARGGDAFNLIEQGLTSEAAAFPMMGLALGARRAKFKSMTEQGTNANALRGLIAGEKGRIIPYKGKMYDISEFLELPEISNFLTMFDLQTGRAARAEVGRFPNIQTLIDLVKTLPGEGAEHPIGKMLKGLYAFSGAKNAKFQEGVLPGGITNADIEEYLKTGPTTVHASVIAKLKSGQYDWETKMGEGIGLVGKLLGPEYEKAMKLKYTEETLERFRKGNIMEMSIAFDEQLNRGFALIPRGYGEKRIKAKFGQHTVLGLPDFIKVVDGPDGPELQIMEAKLTANSQAQAAVQNPLYVEMIKRAAKEDPDALKSVFESWESATKDMYSYAQGMDRTIKNPLDANFVEKALAAAKAGKVKPFFISKYRETDSVPRYFYEQKQQDKGWDQLVSDTVKKMAGEMPDILTQVLHLAVTGQITSSRNSTLEVDQVKNITPLAKLVQAFHNVAKLRPRLLNGGLGNVLLSDMEESDPLGLQKTATEDAIAAAMAQRGANRAETNQLAEKGLPATVGENSSVELLARTGTESTQVIVGNEAQLNTMLDHLLTGKLKMALSNTGGANTGAGTPGGGGGGGAPKPPSNTPPPPKQQPPPNKPPRNEGPKLDAEKYKAIYEGIVAYAEVEALMPELMQAAQEMATRTDASIEIRDPSQVVDAMWGLLGSDPKEFARMAKGRKGLFQAVSSSIGKWGVMSRTLGGAGMRQDLLARAPELEEAVKRTEIGVGALATGKRTDMEAMAMLGAASAQAAKYADVEYKLKPEFAALGPQQASKIIQETAGELAKINAALKPFEAGVTSSAKTLDVYSKQGMKAMQVLSDAVKSTTSERGLLKGQISSLEQATAGVYGYEGKTYRRVKDTAGVTHDVELTGSEAQQATQQLQELRGYKEAEAKLVAQEKAATPRALRTERIGTGLRNIFGGFGFFYMQRVLGWGAEALTQGGQEYEQYQQQEAAVSARLLSTGALQRPTAYSRRRAALIRAGGTSLSGTLADLGASLTGTPLGDVLNASKVGAGAGLAGAFALSELSAVLPAGFTTAAMPWMLPLAGAVGVGALALQQAQFRRNPDQAIIRAMSERDAYLENRKLVTERLAETQGAVIMPGGARPVTDRTQPDYWALKSATPETRARFAQQVGFTDEFLAGSRRKFTESEVGVILDRIVTSGKSAFSGLSEESAAYGITIAGITGKGQETALKLARLREAGAPTEEYFTAVSGLTGQKLSLELRGDVAEKLVTNIDDLASQMEGLQKMGAAPSELFRQLYGKELTSEQIMGTAVRATREGQIGQGVSYVGGMAEQFREFARKPAYRQFLMQGQVAEQAALTGVGGTYYTAEQLAAMTPAQLQAAYAQTTYEGALQQQYTGYIAQGYRAPFANRMIGMERGLRDRFGAAGVVAGNMVYPTTQALISTGVGEDLSTRIAGYTAEQVARGNVGAYNLMQGIRGGDINAIVYRAQQQQVERLTAAGMPMNIAAPYARMQAMTQGLSFGGVNVPFSISPSTGAVGAIYQSYMTQAQGADLVKRGIIDQGTANLAVGGVTPEYSNIARFGIEGLQAQMGNYQIQAQRASVGNAFAQIALQRQYLLGGGKMGRGIWAVQDEQRALAHEQQLWSFEQQRAQQAMSWRQYQENIGLQFAGTQMQRGFTREEWGFNQQQRELTWGWQQEDFAGNIKFMSGRERRMAEKQQERATVMHGLEGERIDRQKEQQEALWALEDTRFETEKKHQEESKAFAEAQLKRQEEFYARNKVLDDEQLQIQRTYQLESLKLQEAAAGAQAYYSEKIAETRQKIEDLQTEQASSLTKWSNALNYSNLIAQIFRDLYHELKDLPTPQEVYNQWNASLNAGDEDAGRATGGAIIAGHRYIVGERGPEPFTSLTSGYIAPNPWSSTVISPGSRAAGGIPTTIIVNIGNEQLAKYVVQSITDKIEV